MRSTSDMTSWTAQSKISSAVRRRNASKPSLAIEGNATLTRAFVEDAFAAIHKFVRSQRLFVHGLWFRFEETSGSTIRPIGVNDLFYFATKRTASENLRVLLRITLKLSKKNASYRRSDAYKPASYLTKSPRTRVRVDGRETSPKTHQQHRSPPVSKLEEGYLR